MFSEPMVRSTQTLHLTCVKISTISNELNQASTWASSPRSTIGCVQNDFLAYGMFSTNLHLSCTDTNTISKCTKTRFHMTHITLEFHWVRPKWFSEAMVHSEQTVHLSCIKISTIFERSGSSFHLSLVTLEYYRVRPKRFLILWYVWHKPCTYLTSRLAISLNSLDRASTWASSPRSTIGSVQIDLSACGTFSTNRAPILRQD
jgi:hypothetical protein